MEDLASAWADAQADLGIAPDLSVLSDLAARWREAGRHYQATPHLKAGLRALERYGAEAALVRLAWFFHDAVYVAGASHNEQKSADWFAAYARERWFAAETAARGHALILNTRDHQGAVSDDPLWPIMNDVGLSVFAAAPADYDRYAAGVWLEYAAIVSRAAFASGRAAFMSQFATRPIFFTPDLYPRESLAHAERASRVAGDIRRHPDLGRLRGDRRASGCPELSEMFARSAKSAPALASFWLARHFWRPLLRSPAPAPSTSREATRQRRVPGRTLECAVGARLKPEGF